MVSYVNEDILALDLKTGWKYMCFRIYIPLYLMDVTIWSPKGNIMPTKSCPYSIFFLNLNWMPMF